MCDARPTLQLSKDCNVEPKFRNYNREVERKFVKVDVVGLGRDWGVWAKISAHLEIYQWIYFTSCKPAVLGTLKRIGEGKNIIVKVLTVEHGCAGVYTVCICKRNFREKIVFLEEELRRK